MKLKAGRRAARGSEEWGKREVPRRRMRGRRRHQGSEGQHVARHECVEVGNS